MLGAGQHVRRSPGSRRSPAAAPDASCLLDVEYDKPAPDCHTELFVKFSRDFDDPARDRGKTQMESEVRFAALSPRPGFPIAVPDAQFADYHRDTGTGMLISRTNPVRHQRYRAAVPQMPRLRDARARRALPRAADRPRAGWRARIGRGDYRSG